MAGKVVGFHAIVVLIDEEAHYNIRIQSGRHGHAPDLDMESGEGRTIGAMSDAIKGAVEILLGAMREAHIVVGREVARA